MSLATSEFTNAVSLHWEDVPFEEKEVHHSYCENGIYNGNVLFKLFYNTQMKMTYVYDVLHDVTYEIPSGAKAKGYVVAFKLFKYCKDNGIVV